MSSNTSNTKVSTKKVFSRLFTLSKELNNEMPDFKWYVVIGIVVFALWAFCLQLGIPELATGAIWFAVAVVCFALGFLTNCTRKMFQRYSFIWDDILGNTFFEKMSIIFSAAADMVSQVFLPEDTSNRTLGSVVLAVFCMMASWTVHSVALFAAYFLFDFVLLGTWLYWPTLILVGMFVSTIFAMTFGYDMIKDEVDELYAEFYGRA